MSRGVGAMRSLGLIYRPTETAGTLRSVATAWAPAGSAWGGFLPAFLTLRSYGAGEGPSGMREMVVHAGIDVRTRDGLEVTAGPEQGSRWRVAAIDESDPRQWTLRLEPYTKAFA